jgi:outer membrane protein assembly factor BamB
MKSYLGAMAASLVLVVAAAGQDERSKLYSTPSPPSREALDRLNLRMAWRTYIPVEGRRDGLLQIQVQGRDLYVQTRSGLVARLDAETGQTLWRTRVGNSYETLHYIAANSRSVFVINGVKLYSLDRNTGATQWDHQLPPGVSAAPVVDEEQIYVCGANGRVYALELPRQLYRGSALIRTPVEEKRSDGKNGDKSDKDDKGTDKEKMEGPKKPAQDFKPTENRDYYSLSEQLRVADIANLRAVLAWEYDLRLRLNMRPLQSEGLLLVPSPSGILSALLKYPNLRTGTTEAFRYDTRSELSARPGRFDDQVFLGCANGDVHAVSVSREGERRWRYTAGTAISRSPIGLDIQVAADRYQQDLYVVAERTGLARLDRETGEPLWRIVRGQRTLTAVPEADRFLAANRKFIYAADRSGRLLVVDRVRGSLLSTYDVRDFVFPVTNEWTDRLYLAANNGLLVCLHDKEYVTPADHRAAEEKPFDVKRLPPVDRETLEDLQKRLTKIKVTEVAGEAMPLRQLLNELERRYDIRIDIASDRTFRDAKMEPITEKPVAFPKVTDVTLGEALKQLLAQVNAEYVLHDRIYVVPGKAKAEKPDKDMEMKKD